MKTWNLLTLTTAALIASAGAGPPAGKLNVVATTPDLAALAAEIGGDAVDVKALAKPTEDPHFVDAKPSHIVTLNRADVLIEGGAELEIGWLPPLLESARNSKIATGAPGHIVASQGVKMLEIPATFDRSRGDVHPFGNPHFLLDPVNVKLIVAQMADHFAQIDPKSAELYKANLKKFNATLDAKLVEWQKQLAPYRGAKIVTYHKDFVYLAERDPRTKAGHRTVARASGDGHRDDEIPGCARDTRATLPESQNRGNGGASDGRGGVGRAAAARRPA